ncbi:MAG TPA: peptidase U34 [Caldilineae bacterium]|nr:peptidase U34 [Caldilineae bacterium]
MCDTFVALHDATADGSVIFGKNSDRDPNEAHELVLIPRSRHPPGSTVKLTYIEIPQVEETYAVLLAKPFWIWGCEMGANEHGVVIGNEAVFTKVPYEKEPGLIGMDFIRLALERADTARAALDVITGLLAQYGQGGNCGFTRKIYYHNSFIIADPSEAWVLETAGREWAAVRVTSGVRSISNAITIGSEWDLASDGLVSYAVERDWCKGREDFHFARCYSDFLYTRFSAARFRQSCTTRRLREKQGQLTVADAMAILRDHGPQAGPDWTPARGLIGSTVCMHAGFGPVRGSQTTGSMVSRLTPEIQTHWLTGTAAPCTGIFKPVWIDAGLPDLGPAPTGTYDEATLWWRHEALHRAVLRDYVVRLSTYQEERDELEAKFIAAAMEHLDASADQRLAFSTQCFAEAAQATERWTERVRSIRPRSRLPWHYALAWRRYNQRAAFPEPE